MNRAFLLLLAMLFLSFPAVAAEAEGEAEPVQETKSIDTFGILTGSDAFKETLWKGTGRPIVEELFPKLPSKTSSPTLKGIIRKLAMSTTEPPAGDGTPGLLFTSRVEHMVNLGEADGALKMLEILPDELMDEKRKELKAKAQLIKLDTDGCEQAEEFKKGKDAAFWNQAEIFCAALKSEKEEADKLIAASKSSSLACCSSIKLADIVALITGGEAKTSTIPLRASAFEAAVLKKAGYSENDSTLAKRLEPYAGIVTVSDSGADWKGDNILNWLSTSKLPNKEKTAAKALVLMESMGEKVPPSVWQKVKPLSPPQRGSTAFEDMLWNMDKAAYAGRQGETLLYALAAIGNAGPAKMHPASLGRIVNSLRTIGMKKEAALIAAESLLE